MRRFAKPLPGERTRLLAADPPAGGWAPFVVQLKDGQTLIPGGTAIVHPTRWDGSAWTAITDAELTVHDTWKQVYAFSMSTPLTHREQIKVYYSQDTRRLETFQPYGLFRKGKSDSTISAGTSGTVSIYIGSTDTLLNLSAALDWAEGGTDLSSNKECFVEYKRDETKWQITGREC